MTGSLISCEVSRKRQKQITFHRKKKNCGCSLWSYNLFELQYFKIKLHIALCGEPSHQLSNTVNHDFLHVLTCRLLQNVYE